MSRHRQTSAKGVSKTAKTSAGTSSTSSEHYDFDEDFMRDYVHILEMVLDRGYEGNNLIGVENVSEEHQADSDDEENGIIGQWQINVTPDTRNKLLEEFEGLENFRLELHHQNDMLNMLVYYLIPEIESHGAAQERKQLSEAHIKEVLDLFSESGYPRLLLISKVKPSSDAIALINTANLMRDGNHPLRLVKFIPTSFFHFNPMRSRYQPRNIGVYRGEEIRDFLSDFPMDEKHKGQEEELMPHLSENDPVSAYYGLRVGELQTFLRRIPMTNFYARVVIPDLETQ